MAHDNDSLTPKHIPPLTSAFPNHQPPIQPPNDEHLAIAPATDTEKATSASINPQHFANLLLEFLSNASNESLAACALGLGLSTYFLLGRAGLVLIGLSGGIVLHATWEYHGQNHGDNLAKTLELKRRREVGLDVVNRILDWRETKTSDQEVNGAATLGTTSPEQTLLDYSSFRPATGAALDSLTSAVVRDYVKWWYSPLLPLDESFPSSCRQTLVQFISTASSHLSRKRPADTFIDFLTNTSSIAIVFMNELSSALMAPGAHNSNCSDALYRYLEQNPDSHLSNVMDVEQQQRKLKAVAEDILHTFLDPAAYKCAPVRAFLREILAGLVLEITVQTCSKPEFINGWIIYLLEEADSEIIDIIDAGVGGATANGNPKTKTPVQSPQNVVMAGRDQGMHAAEGQSNSAIEHKRTVSTAEDAMEEAMQEAKRLTELIAAEEAKRVREMEIEKANQSQAMTATSSSATTPNGPTPNSSASDLAASVPGPEDHETDDALPTMEPAAVPSFTSFDQILPPKQTTALQSGMSNPAPAIPPLTLYNATVSIFDDAQPGEKGTMRSKPQAEYLIQIEPATPQHPGWMIARKYPDFETLHEVLRRISVVSGVPVFVQKHSSLPLWKNRTKAALRSDLEHYLRDALSFDRLAESEGMKRFLEKEQGPDNSVSGANKATFGFPSPAAFETMGKGMLDVLASAPKGAAGGGKAILGGFTGVVGGLGSIGQKKQVSNSPNRPSSTSASRPSSNLTRTELYGSSSIDPATAREPPDSVPEPFNNASREPESVGISLPSQPSVFTPEQTSKAAPVIQHEKAPKHPVTSSRPPTGELNIVDEFKLNLPPPPSEISDEYNAFGDSPRPAKSIENHSIPSSPLLASATFEPSSTGMAIPATSQSQTPGPTAEPLSEAESRVAVELFFALINELYTLSSAWNIRRTLLNAAKSYLLRPGNPSLISIQQLLQSSLESMISDEGIAAHVTKLRESSLPTEDERNNWPVLPSDEEKERLRMRARKLLVQKGMPAALRSVMGAAASGEALGRLFDSLQVESVARGFVFAIILQGIRALAQ